MGNCCGKESPNFAGPGRTLGSAPPTARSDATTLPPARPHNYGATQSKPATQGQGRTLGTAGAADVNDPRSAAANAAEARVAAANSKVPKSQRQTNRATLEEASYAERRQRDADAMADARAWN